MNVDKQLRDSASTSSRLVEQIRDRIVSGDLLPGAKVTEAELAQTYGVNRAPLREALLRLEERRLIERTPFSGTRIFQPSDKMMAELYDIREMLEGLACRRAADLITGEQLAELRRNAKEVTARLEQQQDAAEGQPAIRDFHIRIAEISGNAELQRLLKGEIWHYIRASYRRWVKSADKRLIGARHHEWIIDALSARDGELAEHLMRRHIRSNKHFWEEAQKS